MEYKNIHILNKIATFLLLLILMPALLLLDGCTETIGGNQITNPKNITIKSLNGAVELTGELKSAMTGIYAGGNGSSFLGKHPILRWNGNILNVYTDNNYDSFALRGGIIDARLVFVGTSMNDGRTLSLEAGFRSEEEMQNNIFTGSVSFACSSFSPEGEFMEEINITPYKKIRNDIDGHIIFSHHGGGSCNYSDNSSLAIKYSGIIGVNGIEIDINLSQDGIPFLFHDPVFDNENVISDFCSGPVTNFTMEDIKLLSLLQDGSRIASLEDALNIVLNQTDIKTVWLDIKNPNAISACIDIINKYNRKSIEANKNLDVFIGLPTEETVAEYKNINSSGKHKSLAELSAEVVLELDADAWGPQWDGQYDQAQIGFIHSLGKKVFCWTIDDPVFYKQFSKVNKPDGIITNLPQKMIYEYIIQNN